MVRATYTAARIPGVEAPFDTAHLKVFYPGVYSGVRDEVASGELPVDGVGRLPVVVFLPGVNVNPEGYRWLAEALVDGGFVVCVPTWVGPLFAGLVGITPGIDIEAMKPDTYGSRPAGVLLGPVLEALAALDAGGGAGQLAGRLDLDQVIVGGHSAGGSMALLSADDRWFPTVRGAFAFGAHNEASTMLGWPPGSVLPYYGTTPLLLVAGTEDGVMRASAFRYGEEEEGAARRDPVRRTFDESIGDGRPAWLVVLDGANHLLACHPHDPTSARGFLEDDVDPVLDASSRVVLIDACVALCRAATGDADAADLLKIIATARR